MESIDWDSILRSSVSKNDPISESTDRESLQAPTPMTPHQAEDSKEALDIFDWHPVGFSVSTAFPSHARWHALPVDLAFSTTDSVLFYVHSHIILAASNNRFRFLMPEPGPSMHQSLHSIIDVPETSPNLNIILHLIYNMPSDQFSPSVKTLSDAVDRLESYGIQPNAHVVPGTPLYNLLLSYAPVSPIDLYVLAAKHDLADLATATSPHLLSYDLSKISDEMVEVMGSVYLRRLIFLHLGRCEALKRLLLHPPQPHPLIPSCSPQQQNSLTRSWALSISRLAWDVRPDISVGLLESSLNPLADELNCTACKGRLREHIANLIEEWSKVKVEVVKPMSGPF